VDSLDFASLFSRLTVWAALEAGVIARSGKPSAIGCAACDNGLIAGYLRDSNNDVTSHTFNEPICALPSHLFQMLNYGRLPGLPGETQDFTSANVSIGGVRIELHSISRRLNRQQSMERMARIVRLSGINEVTTRKQSGAWRMSEFDQPRRHYIGRERRRRLILNYTKFFSLHELC